MNCPLNQIKETVSEIWDLYSNEFNLTSNEQLGEPENSALASVVSEIWVVDLYFSYKEGIEAIQQSATWKIWHPTSRFIWY